MKVINKWALVVTLLVGLASCEMKDEIFGKDPMSGDTGVLSLSVETGKKTKGSTDQIDQFPVTITGKDVEYTQKFDTYAELKEAGSVTLPVGTYTIEACSPGEFKSEMDEPFYGGEQEVKIQKDVTTKVSVVCTMQNVKISISFTEEFLATYKDWNINVTDKKQDGHIKTYTKAADGSTPAPVYWKMDESVETIYINGTATTVGGEPVTISGTAKKTNLPEYEVGDETSFIGGDELKIEFSPVKVEGSTPGVEKDGVNITITLFNLEQNENVEIPVSPGTDSGDTEEPGDGEDGGDGEGNEGAPTIDLPADFSYSASTGDGKPASADAWLYTPAGLKSAKVRIETTSSAFEATLKEVDMGGNLLEGVELVNNANIDDLFAGVELEDRSPKPGVTEYKFPVGAFFMFLDNFPGTHKFHITLTDNEDVTVNDVLTITITE